eukprot:m.474085 g.474085  ORF g.474085 m.474085 type:complete len:346 (-) comp57132_c0_seq6:173-1210(-)
MRFCLLGGEQFNRHVRHFSHTELGSQLDLFVSLFSRISSQCRVEEDDFSDPMLMCSSCRGIWHRRCEAHFPSWKPSQTFCSMSCYNTLHRGDPDPCIPLHSGLLRSTKNILNTETLPIFSQHSFTAVLREMRVDYQPMRFQVGDCVAIRATPTEADPRLEWPAVIRTIAFHRTDTPMVYVTWLVPRRGLVLDRASGGYLPKRRDSEASAASASDTDSAVPLIYVFPRAPFEAAQFQLGTHEPCAQSLNSISSILGHIELPPSVLTEVMCQGKSAFGPALLDERRNDQGLYGPLRSANLECATMRLGAPKTLLINPNFKARKHFEEARSVRDRTPSSKFIEALKFS